MGAPVIDRRKALGLGLAGLGWLGLPVGEALAAPQPAAQDLSGVTLRVATFKGEDETFLPLAGLLDTPYKVEFHEFNSGQLEVEAINAGAIDFGGWSEIPLAFAAASKARIRTIAVLKGDVNNQVVLVHKDSGIHSIAGLKGKRVGYVRGTTSHYFLLRMLWNAGLSFEDIEAVNLGVTDGAVAFRSGDIDAWAIYGYAINFAMADGSARVLRNAQGILSGNYLVGVAPAVLSDPPLRAAVADYLVRVAKGWNWVEANKQQWCEALAPVIDVPLPYVRAEFFHETQPYRIVPVDEAAIASAQQVADSFVKAGLISDTVDVRPFFDTSFSSVLTGV
jgi:sulfonate transport system substrate-binding protein